MSTITTLNDWITGASFRWTTNTNFSNLNTDKAEVTGKLSQFAATTSLELKGVISDETGSWALVFADTPTLVTPVIWVATATSINGATITSGTLNGSVTGTNTGDQTIANTSDATSHTATLSATGWSIKLVEGTNITLTTTGTSADWIVTIAATWWGTGTVTATAGSLTSNAVVLGAGTTDTKVSTGITTDGTAQLNLWVNATTIGKVKMFGNTSGDVTIQPTAAAGTATVQTLPATTGTLVNRVTTANGVSASNTDGALSVTLGAITPTTVNTVTISGASTPTLSVTGTTTVSGTNTGNQTIANTSDATSHTVTLSASWWSVQLIEGSNITLTTGGTGSAWTVTIASTASGTWDVVWPASATDNAVARYDTTTGKLLQNSWVTIGDTNIVSWVATLNTQAINATAQADFSYDFSDTILSGWWFTFYWATHRRINDGWSNELIKFPTTSVAGAVNEFTITNAATGTWPTLSATGWDTNIDLNLVTKGTGTVKINWSAIWTWNVTKVGTPVNNQVGVWTGDGTLEGDTALTFDTTTDTLATTLITATTVTANLVWNVTGNASGTAATVTSGTQAAITSAANLATVWTITSGTWNATDIAVADWGTWRSTGTTAYSLIATGTTATGAQQTLANGATTEVLVGGGASALPVWTTATGSWSPVRATSPTLVTPLLGTPTSWTLTNCTGLPVAGITASTSTALWVWSIELWHASDTSITRVSAWVVAVEGVNILLNWWALGTPSSGTLTNATGLPIAGLTASTSTSLGVWSIELWHASDTSIARVSAGVISVEGVTVPTISSTSTLTNKRITKRVVTTTDDATAVIDTDITDEYELSAMANATTFTVTGTPTDWQTLLIRLKDNGSARALTWTMSGGVIGVTLPTTTVISKWSIIGFKYFSSTTSWKAIAVSQEV